MKNVIPLHPKRFKRYQHEYCQDTGWILAVSDDERQRRFAFRCACKAGDRYSQEIMQWPSGYNIVKAKKHHAGDLVDFHRIRPEENEYDVRQRIKASLHRISKPESQDDWFPA